MKFCAKVMAANAVVETIELDAANQDEARRVIESSGARLLDLRAQRAGLGRADATKSFNLAIFNQQLFSLLDAGQPVVDAIQVLGMNDKRGKHRSIYDAMLQSLRQGNQLSDAMAGLPSVFPSLYVAMVRASETTGTVRSAIKRFMQYQKQVDEIRSKLKAAATYPAILLGVGFVVIAFLMLYVMPRFSQVFEDVSSKGNTSAAFVQVWGSFVRHHTVLAWSGIGALAVAIGVIFLHPGTRAWAGRKLLATPWIGERVWTLQLARMYRTLGMLLRSGVSILAALKMTENSLPDTMQAKLRAATQSISEGQAMSAVLAQHALSTEVAQRLLLAGESSGNLDEMMERIADFYDQETSAWIDAAGRIIEPALMVGIGLIVGVIVLLLYSPIFDLANAV
jgi:general secretion pathway protein F